MKEVKKVSTLKPKLLTTLKDYNREQFFKDMTAGIIVSIIALPLSIALAIASGVTPEKGLYTAIIAGFLISLLGGSRVQIGGPTGAFMVIVFSIVSQYGVEGLTIATLMAGIMMVAFGLLGVGKMIKFIPYPITTGFTSGIALVIFSSQIKDLLGLKINDVPAEFLEKWQCYLVNIHSLDITTSLIGLLSLGIIILWPKINEKIPGAFVALVVSSLMVKGMGLEVATIGSKFGTLSSEIPHLSMPHISYEKIILLLGPAATIAMLGSIESLLSAVVSDGMIGGKHRSNMELIAQGIGNIGSALFGGIPATGAIARTVANIKNGGRTPIAGMVHALSLLFILVVFMPYAKMIPLATLAAILVVVAYNMSEWREFVSLFKSPKSDVIVLLTTFFITVLIDLVKAIEIGMLLAVFLFMKRMSDVADIDIDGWDASEGETTKLTEYKALKDRGNIQLYQINGPFFFGAADKFMTALNQLAPHTQVLIIGLEHVPAMDATALHGLRQMLHLCHKRKIKTILYGLQDQPIQTLEKSGLLKDFGDVHRLDNQLSAIQLALDL